MEQNSKLKNEFKNILFKVLCVIALVSVTLAGMKLAGFSAFVENKENVEITEVQKNVIVRGTTTTVTVAGDGAIVCEDIIQGVRDCNLADGNYTFRVTGVDSAGNVETKDYPVELINYYNDVHYTTSDGIEETDDNGHTTFAVNLGDDSTDYKMLVVKYHKNLIIDEGVKLTAKSVNKLTYKKGMYVCVLGKITNNGEISMTARGTYNQEGENVYLWKKLDSSFAYVPAVGGAGADDYWAGGNRYSSGTAGHDGVARGTGGGGAGGAILGDCNYGSTIYGGTAGTSYSGGSGSGGLGANLYSNYHNEKASPNGGAGGPGVGYRGSSSWAGRGAGGGTGNTGGLGASNYYNGGTYQCGNYAVNKGNDGTGGLLILYSRELENNSIISADGIKSSVPDAGHFPAGGASGGGSVNIFTEYMSGNGELSAKGGASAQYSGKGGEGTVTVAKVGSALSYPEEKIYIDVGFTKNIKEDMFYDVPDSEYASPLSLGKLTYSIADTSIATIDSKGILTGVAYGETTLTITDAGNNKDRVIPVVVCRSFDSIVQGFRDSNMPDGNYEIAIKGTVMNFEVINYYDDMHYTLDDGEESKVVELGDSTTDYKTLIVKYHKNLTVDKGVTLTAKQVDNLTYKKGMYICVLGDIVNNGEITMTARGTYNQEGENVYLWKNTNKTYEFVPAQGGVGAPDVTFRWDGGGAKGGNGENRGTGAGGTGGGRTDDEGAYLVMRGGSKGTSYSGGSGSGGVNLNFSGGTYYNAMAEENGGAGGVGSAGRGSSSWAYRTASGGVGNLGGLGGQSDGSGYKQGNTTNYTGPNGTGGLLIVYADEIYNYNKITANGVDASTSTYYAGGASGGGSLNVFTRNMAIEGTVTANGGQKYGAGGAGGDGCATITLVGSRLNYTEKSLVLNVSDTHSIDKNKLSYQKLDEVQTKEIGLGTVTFESLDTLIATVNSSGVITAVNEGKTKIKITDTTNNISTYIYVDVVRTAKMAIEAGKNFTVSLKANGTVWTYGLNDKGQLGIGNNENKNTPVKVESLDDVTQIATGYSHTLALLKNGKVYSFGAGALGQLGDSMEEDSNSPVKVDGISNIVKVDAWKNSSFALDKDGRVYVWGENYSRLPMKVVFTEKVVDISGNMVVTEKGQVYCLNDLTTPVEGLNGIAKISCGETHYLALDVDGIVSVWGSNTYGECATETTGVTGVKAIADGVREISAGNHMSMYSKENGEAYVLGNNASGQIGQSDIAKITTPTKIVLTENVKVEEVLVGEGEHSGVVDENGFVWLTGTNLNGELGIGSSEGQQTYTKTGDSIITIDQNEPVYLDVGESVTISSVLENTYNLKIDVIDDVQSHFTYELSNSGKMSLSGRTITANNYGKATLTITYPSTGKTKQVQIASVMKMDSIVQGLRDTELADGDYEILVNDQIYSVELINYYDDMRYSLGDGETSKVVSLGDDSTDYKTLVVKYHGDLTIDKDVTLTAKNVDNLTYKKGMYICVLGDIHNNGTISMKARGTYNQEGENVYLWHNTDDTYEYVPADSDNEGETTSVWVKGGIYGPKGIDGENRSTGGGGTGGAVSGDYGYTWKRYGGASGTSYSGGSGSGSANGSWRSGYVDNGKPEPNGGAGGTGIALRQGTSGWSYRTASGGTGNLGGQGAETPGASVYIANSTNPSYYGNNGTGGLLILYADNLYNNNLITADGVDSTNVWVSGGASGGGSVNIFANTVVAKGIITADGGKGYYYAGPGGNGSVSIDELGSLLNYNKKSLTLNIAETYLIDKTKLGYTKLNDIQTEDLTLGSLVYESLNTSIATVDSTGKITGVSVGKTKIKITDVTNGYSTYIIVNVTKEELITPQIKEGENFTISLKANGTVWAYGLNDKGQLGTGTTDNSNIPVPVLDDQGKELKDFVEIEAGDSSSIAVDKYGNVYTWGVNSYLKNTTNEETGVTTSSLVTENLLNATKVNDLNDIVKVETYGNNFYAIDITGNLYAWGKDYSQITSLPLSEPVIDIAQDIVLGQNGLVYNVKDAGKPIDYLSNICEIEAGEDHYLFVNLDGYVCSLGKNDYGQLGDGSTTERTVPVLVKTETGYLQNVANISAGSKASMAVTFDGKVYSFGQNNTSKLGIDSASSNIAVQVVNTQDLEDNALELERFEVVETGKNHSSIMDKNGFVYNSGLNTQGQLGTEDNTNRTIFTKIGTIGITLRPEFVTVVRGITQDFCIIPSNSFNLKTDISYNANIETNVINEKEASIVEISGVDNSEVTNTKQYAENYRLTGNKIGRTLITAKTADCSKNIWVNVVNNENAKASAKVVNGKGFTVSLKADGTVWSWGANNNGQLGIGTTESHNEPQQIEIAEEIIDISSGEGHTLLLGKSGKVYSFGLNSNGQLGTGNLSMYKVPVAINLGNIAKVIAKNNTSFAITEEGKVYAWGNGYTKTPTLLEIERNVVDIGVNYYLADDGIVRNIESNTAIMLSLNETLPSELPVIENEKIVQISEGVDSVLMLAQSGRVYSYGTNTYGQLGDGTLVSKQSGISTVVKTEANNILENVKEVSAGDRYGVAVTFDGKVYVFGINETKQLGYDNIVEDGGIQESHYAILKEDVTNIERVTAGFLHTSVYKRDGNVYTWGEGTDGELGNGDTSSYHEAQNVGKNTIKTNSNEIVTEVEDTFDIDAWINYFNLFGDIDTSFTYEILDGSKALVDALSGEGMGISSGRTSVIVKSGTSDEIAVVKLLVLDKGSKPANMDIHIEPQVETYGNHVAMLKVDGTVWCYGLGTYGELGNGYTENSDEPVKALFPAGTIITKIAVGENHCLALDSKGNVWVWGRNNYYQLGNDSNENILTPTKITKLSNIKDIACGPNTSFAVTESGEVYGWGLNANGECGIGSYTNKITINKAKYMTDVIDIKAGKNHTIALKSNGEVFVTGSNLYGELALDMNTRKVNLFTKVDSLKNVVAISAGDSNNMVIKTDGKVYAWGENIYKELGTGETATYSNVPVKVNGLTDIRYIDGGKGYNLAINSNGDLYEIGLNSSSELGNGTNTNVTEFTRLTTIDKVLQVSAGLGYTTYLKQDGTVWANGDYTRGDLDIKAKTRSNVPVQVGNDETGLGITEVTLGIDGTKKISENCAYALNLIKLDDNFADTLNYVSLNENIATVDENGVVTGKRIGTTRVNATSSINGRVYSVLVKVVQNNSQIAPKVVAGENFATVLKADGSLWSFGYNSDGRLGIGSTITSDVPAKTNILATYIDVKAGRNFIIALRSDGKVWAVGNNEKGALANGTTTSKNKFVEVAGLDSITKIAAGDNFGLALDNLGIVYKWGNGVLEPEIMQVTSQRIIDISAGNSQSVFVTAKGNVIGKGDILNTQIDGIDNAVKAQVASDSIIILTSNGKVYKYKDDTLSLINVENVIDISANQGNVMYQTIDENTYVSGLNTNGELGIGGATSVNTPVPTTKHSSDTFGIGVGYRNTYIINNSGNLYSAGANEYGSLGNGTRTSSDEHLLVGNRTFNIEPESATMKVGDVEEVKITGEPFNVFEGKEISSDEYTWVGDADTIVNVEPGKFTALDVGTAHITVTDKLTGDEKTVTRVVIAQDKDRIKKITVNDEEAELSTDSSESDMKYRVKVVTNSNKGILKIWTNDNTDRISIDNKENWSYNGILNQEITLENKITELPIVIGIQNNAGEYPVEENYTLIIEKITDDVELKQITATSVDSLGITTEITATPVNLTRYEVVVEENTDISTVKVVTNEFTSISIDGLEYELNTQSKPITLDSFSKEVPIAVKTEAGTIAEYTLVIYKKNEAMELSDVIVNEKHASKVSEGTYAVTIDKDLDVANILASVSNSIAKVSIANNEYKPQFNTKVLDIYSDVTEVSIKVKLGEDVKDYLLYIYREKDTSDDIEVKMDMVMVNSNVIEPEADGLTYIAYLPSSEIKATIRAIAKDSNTKVKIDDFEEEDGESLKEVNTPLSENTYTIKLKDSLDNETEYTVIIRKADSDASLKEVYVSKDDKEIKAKLQSDGTYLVKVPSSYTNVDVTAVTGYILSQVQVNETGEYVVHEDTQNAELSGDVTEVKINVKSKDGSVEKEYILKIQKEANNADLFKVQVDGEDAVLGDDGNYHYYLTNALMNVNVKAITDDENASVRIDNSQYGIHEILKQIDITSKQTIVPIKVKAEDGTIRDYSLIIEGLPDDTTIKQVVVNGVQATYIEGRNRYEVRSDDTSFNIEVTLTDLLATMVLGDNEEAQGIDSITVSKQGSETIVKVIVTSQNKLETEEYTIAILEKSSNTNIDTIKVNGKLIGPRLDGTYYIGLKHDTSKISVEAIAEDLYAVTQINDLANDSYIAGVTEDVIDGTRTYTYEILVTAEDGTQVTYTLIVEILDGNTNILNVKVGKDELNLNDATLVEEGKYYYKIERVSSGYVNIELESDKSTVTINGVNGPTVEVSLTEEINTIPVVITAEDGTTKEISVIIEKKSANTSIKKIEGAGVLSAEIGTNEAQVYIDEDLSEVDLAIILTNEYGSLKLQSETDYELAQITRTINYAAYEADGVSSVPISIKAEDGTEKEYTINIYKKANLELEEVIVNSDTLTYDEEIEGYSKLVANGNKPAITITTKNSLQTIQLINEEGTVVATGTGTLTTNQDLSTTKLTDKFKIKVISHNGEEYGAKEYNLWITQRSTETGIAYIKVDGLGTTQEDDNFSAIVSGKETYPLEIKLKDQNAIVRVEDDSGNILIGTQKGVLRGNIAIQDGETRIFKVIVTSENGETKEYTLNVERISSNLEISEIRITDYDDSLIEISRLVTAYDEKTKTYKIVVNKNLEETTIDVTTVSSFTNIVLDNTYSANGNVSMTKDLPGLGVTTVTIKLTAADGSVETKYLEIVQLSDEIGIYNVSVNGLECTPDELGNYEATVTDENDIAKVNVILPMDTSKVSIGGQNENYGASVANINTTNKRTIAVPIKVTAEDGTSYTYMLTIHAISHDSSVKFVKVDDTLCTFKDDKYVVYIDRNETEASAFVKAGVEYSTVKHIMEDDTEVSGIEELSYIVDTSDLIQEVFTSTFTVIAEDGTISEYTVELIRKDDDKSISNVYVNEEEVEVNSGHETYTDGTYGPVPIVGNVAKVKVVANSEFAIVEFNGKSANNELEQTINLSTDDKITEVPVRITSQQGTVYDTVIYLEKVSDNNNLEFVKVNLVNIDQDENGVFVSYIYDTFDHVQVDIKAENENALVMRTTEDGIQYLDGSGASSKAKGLLTMDVDTPDIVQTIYFKIIAENGDESEVYALRIEKMSTDATLKEIYVDGLLIEPNAEGRYETTILDTNTFPLIKAVTNHDKAYVRIALGDERLVVSEHNVNINSSRQVIIPITVRSQAGTTKVTYLYLNKISTSLKLDIITLDGKEADIYNESTHTYRFLVDNESTQFELLAVAENDYSILEYNSEQYDASLRTIVDMELTEQGKVLKLKEKSEAGDELEYTIEIVRRSEDTSLEYLKVNDVTRTPDETGGDVYTVYIPKDATSATIEVRTNYSFANVRLGDNEPIRQYDKGVLDISDIDEERIIVPIVVTAVDGTTIRTYNVVLVRRGAGIGGKVITQNYEDKHVSEIIVYRTDDLREIDDEYDPREVIYTGVTEEDGTFAIELPCYHEYDIIFKKSGYLTHTITHVYIEEFEIVTLDDIELYAGDVDENGEIELDDLVELNDMIGMEVTDENKIYDLNEDGVIDNNDRKILKKNYHKKEESEVWVKPVSLTTSMSPTSLTSSAMPTNTMQLNNTVKPDFVYPLDKGFTVTSDYGTRVDPIDGSTSFHSGIDLCGPHHGNIYAIADGEVTWAGVQSSYGNCVEIKHVVNGVEVYSFYAHMSRIDVNKGDKVSQGDVIGLEGGDQATDPNPGRTTGHHLHFEMRSASGYANNVNPRNYLEF